MSAAVAQQGGAAFALPGGLQRSQEPRLPPALRASAQGLPKVAAAAGTGNTAANGQAVFAAGAAAVGGLAAASRARRRQNARRSAKAMTRLATLEKERTETTTREDIRNIAIIAHVDHGKTTLTDALMKQTGRIASSSMDSNLIEKERGITILAKNAAIKYKGVKINIIDTPGHADFGGEVERILNMADACLLLVDAQEGPMPQTKFVLRQALKLEKRVIVCINKVDKPAARPDWVLDTTFDLFSSLGASDELCDFPVVYASGFHGVASREGPNKLEQDLKPLLDLILEECPPPQTSDATGVQVLVTNLDYDDYVGRISIGRVSSGSIKVGQQVGFQYGPDGEIRKASVSKLWEFSNNERKEIAEVKSGDICAFAGMDDVHIGDTVVDMSNPMALPPIIVEEPTVAMEFGVNCSPLAGQLKESTKLTTQLIKARLDKECLTNLALRVEPGSSSKSYRVKGRGTLQLGILIENMRREGFELMIGPPEVILQIDPATGKKTEPYEEAVIDVPADYQGIILEEMSKKGALMQSMETASVAGNVVLTFVIATRNLIGLQSTFMQRTKGQAVLTARFAHWGEFLGETARSRDKGSVIATDPGEATFYSIENASNRARFWIEPGDAVYAGMCIGINNKDDDLSLNITKEKKVTNVRAAGATLNTTLSPKIQMNIDDFLGHMDRDEMLEVTPGPLRLLKKSSKALKAL